MGNLASVYNACSKFTKRFKNCKKCRWFKKFRQNKYYQSWAYKDAMQHFKIMT